MSSSANSKARRSAGPGHPASLVLRAMLGLVAAMAVLAPRAGAEVAPGSLSGQAFAYGDDAVGWPVSPTDKQHPIRGSFLDPRPGEIAGGGDPVYHIGIDSGVRDDKPGA